MASLQDQTSFFHFINHMFILQRSIAARRRSCPYASLLAMSTYFHKHFKILQKARIISSLTGKAREHLKAVYSLKVHISYMIRIKQKMSKSTNSQVMCLSQNRHICPIKNVKPQARIYPQERYLSSSFTKGLLLPIWCFNLATLSAKHLWNIVGNQPAFVHGVISMGKCVLSSK